MYLVNYLSMTRSVYSLLGIFVLVLVLICLFLWSFWIPAIMSIFVYWGLLLLGLRILLRIITLVERLVAPEHVLIQLFQMLLPLWRNHRRWNCWVYRWHTWLRPCVYVFFCEMILLVLHHRTIMLVHWPILTCYPLVLKYEYYVLY